MASRHFQKKKRHTSKVMLGVSFVFHTAIVLALAYFAAKEGLLGKQIQNIVV